MIKLWKDENKNKQFREILENVRKDNRPLSWKYYTMEERMYAVANKYDCSVAMAKKIVWIMCGDCARQYEICDALGKEYAMYVPTGYGR